MSHDQVAHIVFNIGGGVGVLVVHRCGHVVFSFHHYRISLEWVVL